MNIFRWGALVVVSGFRLRCSRQMDARVTRAFAARSHLRLPQARSGSRHHLVPASCSPAAKRTNIGVYHFLQASGVRDRLFQLGDMMILKGGMSQIVAMGRVVARDGKFKDSGDKDWLMDFDGWILPTWCYVERPVFSKGAKRPPNPLRTTKTHSEHPSAVLPALLPADQFGTSCLQSL